jgi:hypothetical protein
MQDKNYAQFVHQESGGNHHCVIVIRYTVLTPQRSATMLTGHLHNYYGQQSNKNTKEKTDKTCIYI